MLDELKRITSKEPYASSGGMWVKEVTISPWSNPDAKIVFELLENDWLDEPPQVWEVSCIGLASTKGIPQALIPTTQIKVYDEHPILWKYENEIAFSIISRATDIPSLMGDLFIEHSKSCGDWIDFHWLYSSLPETLTTLRENQLIIPSRLQNGCFSVLENYGVQYVINEVQENEKGYRLLFFSNSENWPDEVNFGQSHVVAKEFTERKIR